MSPTGATSGCGRDDEGGTGVAPADGRRRSQVVDRKLGIVVVPVADVDRATAFDTRPAWREDADEQAGHATQAAHA